MSEITLIDVGARGDLVEPWKSASPPVHVIGFEADPVEHDRLSREYPSRTYHPFGLGNPAQQGQQAELHLTLERARSSLYPPSETNVAFEPEHWSTRRVEAVAQIPISRLDDCLGDVWIDAIKIDTQGSEMAILEGAQVTLKRTLPFLFLETWVHEVYKGAPLMHEIVGLCHDLGYEVLAAAPAAAWRLDVGDISPVDLSHGRLRLIGLNLLMSPSVDAIAVVCSEEQLRPRVAIMEMFGFDDIALRLARLTNDERFLHGVVARVESRSRSRLQVMFRRISKKALTRATTVFHRNPRHASIT